MTAILLPRPTSNEPPAPSRVARPPDKGRDPRWVKPAVFGLLAATAILYLWGLGASGWANSFYSAAVQAGTKSWKAMFFGSSDASNFITVDKPPAALWVMDISARLFGVNAWSILIPQALEGVAAVGVLYLAVRRWFGAGAGLIAGAVLALTPAAALMFRFNNPDALLVLLLTGAAYATVRAIEGGRTKWLILASTLIGFGFLTKMLQAFVVVPVFALAYLIAGPPKLGRRLFQLAMAGIALIVSSLWWVVAVMAIPAADRPFIGGSQNNSLWNLIFGYNGFGRLTGNESGSVGGGGGTTGRWGATGLFRMFNSEFGGQISWLLPAAVILLVAGSIMTWKMTRTDRTRAALVIWGGWLAFTGLVFSLGQGIIHPYYTVALAPAIGGVVGVGSVALWRSRSNWWARAGLALAVAATSVWSFILLDRTPSWLPILRNLDLIAGLAIAVLIVAWSHLKGPMTAVVVAAALVVGLAGPAAYSIQTASVSHSGAIPSAGPAVAGGFGPGGGQGRPTGGFGGGGGAGGGRGGGAGSLLSGSTSNATLTAALKTDAGKYTWVAAAIGSNDAAGYQLASGEPVMAIGGFNGTDPSPTLAQFETWVKEGKIHYFIAGGGGGGGGGGATSSSTSVSSQITSWVESHYTATTVGGVTVYELTSASTS
jgi:4-amino-4-deoxy-L-arabinose transferase-like glycosyltransferase